MSERPPILDLRTDEKEPEPTRAELRTLGQRLQHFAKAMLWTATGLRAWNRRKQARANAKRPRDRGVLPPGADLLRELEELRDQGLSDGEAYSAIFHRYEHADESGIRKKIRRAAGAR